MANLIHAFTDDAIGKMDAVDIAAAIASKEISETEAIEAAINRAEKVNPALNAIAIKMYDDARKNLKTPSKGGSFKGVPTFMKDTEDIAGYPTQLGTGSFQAKVASKNSKFANQILSTGLRNLGKTTLPEFGFICSTENERWGITRNPWNTDYTSGGSSSGSAALVAAGVVPIASGNDGAGSIRIPAAICGLVGLKPSRHRLHGLDGGKLMPIQIIHQGVLSRTVRDTALFYHEAEKYYYNKHLPQLGHITQPGKKRLRIAFFHNMPEGDTGHQDEVTYQTQIDTAKLLSSLGHEVEQVMMPVDADTMVNHFLNYYGLISYMATHWSRLSIKAKVNHKLLEPFTVGLSRKFKANVLKLPTSIRIMRKIGKQMNQLFEKYDVLMSPTMAHQTPKIGYFSPELTYEEVSDRAVNFSAFCGIHNITGNPAISLPMGLDSNGMPLGVQFVAPYGLDKRLIELAYELEQAKKWKSIYDI